VHHRRHARLGSHQGHALREGAGCPSDWSELPRADYPRGVQDRNHSREHLYSGPGGAWSPEAGPSPTRWCINSRAMGWARVAASESAAIR
jgi:hypothetical protein